jgi:hypothetical protein
MVEEVLQWFRLVKVMQILGAQKKKRVAYRQDIPKFCCSKNPESFIEQGLRGTFRVPQFRR